MLQFDAGTPEFNLLYNVLLSSGTLNGRQDAAGDTLFLARELEQVSARSYDVLKDPMLARTFVPIVAELADGAESWSYDMYDGFAKADWITDFGRPVGQADVFKTRYTHTPRMFGSHYQYSIEEIARSQFGGRPIDREKSKMCRIGHEQFLEDLIAVGDSTRSIAGLVNNANIPTVAAAVGSWSASTSPAQLMADLNKLVQAPEQASAQRFVANRLILPLSVKTFLTTSYSTLNGETTEAVWLRQQPSNGVKKIDYWKRLNTANAGGTGGRALAYHNSPDVIKFVLGYDYRELPAQAAGYAFQILTHARVLGIVTVYPYGAAKMDLQ